jgi:predicted RecB family nuclease
VRTDDRRLLFSPTDLTAFLACPHLTSLEVAVARGELARPFRQNPHADLIRRKGEEHEARYLDSLLADGLGVVTISFDDRDWVRAARETEEAIRAGADVVYQARLAQDNWRGAADFVVRTADGSYEAVDTKLARHAKPPHVLQLCFYTEQLARIQGRMPAAMHVVTGLGETESFRPGDYLAHYRRLRRRFVQAVEERDSTYPYPVDFCSLCDFLSLCKAQWERDDHLVLVAGVSRLQVERLTTAVIDTLTELAEAAPGTKVKSMRPATFQSLRHQAELQLHHRRTGEHRVDLLPVEAERGFGLLPEPSAGDMWLDFEGDPWFELARGLEYLAGWAELDPHGRPVYRCLWAHDRASEQRAFEQLVDHIVERRRRYPGMHVYHYAPYERTALTRLMGEHATREQEIDDLLRGEVLVDLYRVTRQALRASLPRYSLKDVEELYGFARTAEVGGGGESVQAFEAWLEVGDDSLLAGVRDYNEEDCRSLYELHRWLLELRPADLAWRPPPEAREPDEEAEEHQEERDRVRDALLAGAVEGEPRWLLGHLLDYHRREEKPQWWEYFFHRKLDPEELVEDGDTIGDLEPVGEPIRLPPPARSWEYTLKFPLQEHKLGGEAEDPATGKSYDVTVDDEHGTVTFCRAVARAEEPLPRALIPPPPLVAGVQRRALFRLAKEPERYPMLAEVLERRPPRAKLDGTPIEAALSLGGSYLFVQGPPGSGKTYTGARMAVALMAAGRRVGVTALSHKAIHKLLEEIEEAAVTAGVEFRGRKKSNGEGTEFAGRFIESSPANEDLLDRELDLVAGTSWLFTRQEMETDGWVDTLFVDEAGQVALADALAVGTAARNLILLGDPNQLPQVSQGAHPPGTSASVLQHLLGQEETVRPGMGIFLAETWRLRPEVCAFTSQAFYEGRLEPAPVTSTRSVLDGDGVRFLPVAHTTHRTASPEEAQAVAAEIDRLVGTPYLVGDRTRPLGYEDFIVVAPYNAHVRCLREKLPEAVRVGTVDKFQGQQAVVAFFSMASSSGDDVSRGLEFLFSRNRLNVAVSRAKCLAYLVASPRLLDANCKTIEQMRLANALCQFVEAAGG